MQSSSKETHSLAAKEHLERFEQIPREQRCPETDTYALIKQMGQQFGDDTAIEFLLNAQPGEVTTAVSYAQLAQHITQTANLLHNHGMGATDTVAILLPNLIQSYYAIWGGQAAGIVSPLNHLLDPVHIVEIMNETRAKVLITLAPSASGGLWQKVERIIEQVPSLKTVLLVRQPGLTEDALPEVAHWPVDLVDFNQALAEQSSDKLISDRTFEGSDTAAYFHTGGTTGRPKIAKISHDNIAFIAQLYVDQTESMGRFTALAPLPMFHMFAVVVAGIGTLLAGRSLVIMTPDGFRNPNVVANWWYFIAHYRTKWFASVPTILAALLNAPAGDYDTSCLSTVLCGSAALPPKLKQDFEEKFRARVYNGYGMTESTNSLTRSVPSLPQSEGSVGVRLPYCELITAHVDGTKLVKVCEFGEAGVILARGPNMFAGYLDPADSAEAWVGDGWFNTGDMGLLDEHGSLYLTGRAKDLIIRGGHNIDPVIIEEPLSRHPAVSMAAAIGQPDAYAGEIPVAYVCLKPGHTIEESELLDYCKAKISERAAIPKRIEILPELPLTAVGKIFKPTLRNRATEYVASVLLAEAGIETTTISAVQDPQRGQVIRVSLRTPAQLEAAKNTLGNLPVHVEYSEMNV